MPHIVVRTPNEAETCASEEDDALFRQKSAQKAEETDASPGIAGPRHAANGAAARTSPHAQRHRAVGSAAHGRAPSSDVAAAEARAATVADDDSQDAQPDFSLPYSPDPNKLKSMDARQSVLLTLDAALEVARRLTTLKEAAAAYAALPANATTDLTDQLGMAKDIDPAEALLSFDREVVKKVSFVFNELAIFLGAQKHGDVIRGGERGGNVFMKLPLPFEELRNQNTAESTRHTRNRRRAVLSKCVSHIYGRDVTLQDLVETTDGSKEEIDNALVLSRQRGPGWHTWKMRYDQLKIYAALAGTCWVRQPTRDDPPGSLIRNLFPWAQKQRFQYRLQRKVAEQGETLELKEHHKIVLQPTSSSYLTDYRIELLSELNFEWEVPAVPEESRCKAISTRGRPCKQAAARDTKYCDIHKDYETNPPKMKKRLQEVPENLRCKAEARAGRRGPCLRAAIDNTNYCELHQNYDTNPWPLMARNKRKCDDAGDGHGKADDSQVADQDGD